MTSAEITRTDRDVTIRIHGIDVTVCKSGGSDGATVVFVDTSPEDVNADGTPTCRVLLNDDPIYTGTEYAP